LTCNNLNYVLGSGIEVDINNEKVNVIIESRLYQNITKFPETDTNVVGSELEMAKFAFEDALKVQEQNLEISNLSIYVISDDSWLNVTAIFELNGISSSDNEVVSTDLSWIPFTVVSDLKVGNLSYNLAGEKYLRPAIYELANQSAPGHELANQSNVNFFSPYFTPITTTMAMNVAGNVTTFDFTSVSTNFSSWNKHFDENSFMTSWNYPARKKLDLRVQITSENVTDIRTGTAFYSYTDTYASVSIPGYGIIVDNFITYENSTSKYSIIMLSIIIILIGLIIVSHYAGKRIMKTRKPSK
jgi:hypothetical protein